MDPFQFDDETRHDASDGISPLAFGIRLTCVPYTADGNAPFFATASMYLALMLTGIASGWFVRELMAPLMCCAVCISGPLLLMVLGVALGGVGYVAVTWGRIANPRIAGFAGLSGMAGALLGLLISDHQNMAVPRPDFGEFVFNQESVVYFSLGFSFLIGSGSCYAVIAAAANRPFCAITQKWKHRYTLGRPRMWRTQVIDAIQTGDLLRFVDVPMNAGQGHAEVIAYVSAGGGEAATIVLEVRDVVLNEKKKPVEMSLGIFTFEGTIWPILESLFPGRLPDPDAHGDGRDRLQLDL